LIFTFRTRVPSVAVNLNLQYGFKFGNVKTLNCSSEQIRTLCEVTDVDEVGETLSELIVVDIGVFKTEDVDSIVGILEPCPID
jgi:hypothetical protein